MWPSKISAVVESTTFCNARCPQCSRTASKYNTKGPQPAKKVDWLPQKSWSFKDFKFMFNDKTLSVLNSLHFSGTFGDPGMNPDLVDIAWYLRDNNVGCTINSNGSMQDENWWFKIGAYATTVTFDVDGINQDMHNQYRRGTKLAKTLKNMESAVSAGGATVKVFTVIFKHNEDHIDAITDMVMERGILRHNHTAVESNRFSQGPTFEFINENGELDKLEQTTKPEYLRSRDTTTRRIRDHKDDTDSYNTIVCNAAKRGTVHVSNTGIVYPCCYLAGPMDRTVSYNGPHASPIDHHLLQEIKKTSFLYNLKFTSLPEILSSDWFTGKLKKSFTEDPIHYCKRMCGKCK